MRAADENLHFPVLGFSPDRQAWGFGDLHTLTACGGRSIVERKHIGMELIDSDGRRWVIRSAEPRGSARSFLGGLFWTLLSGRLYRVELDLDRLEPVTFREVQDRACASVEAVPDVHFAEEDRDTELEPLLAQIRATQTNADIIDLLGLDSLAGN